MLLFQQKKELCFPPKLKYTWRELNYPCAAPRRVCGYLQDLAPCRISPYKQSLPVSLPMDQGFPRRGKRRVSGIPFTSPWSLCCGLCCIAPRAQTMPGRVPSSRFALEHPPTA